MIYYDINGLPFNEKGNLVISAGTAGNRQIATPADYSALKNPPAYIPDTNTIISNTQRSSAFDGVETTLGGVPITQGATPTGTGTGSGSASSSYSRTTRSTGSYTGSGQKPAPYESNVQMPGAYDGSQYYENVGTPESNAPDYSLNYLMGPVGQAYSDAMQRIAADLGERPTYNNQYDQMLNDAYQNIVNRDPFSWSAEDDPFYQDYATRYTQLGQQAMRDTMGQAAALTGGYGNTYAQFAGQGAYNQYMAALADKQIELENRAYQRYQDAGDELYRQYSMLGDLRDTEYGRYRDAVSDYNYNLALMQAQEAEDYERAVYNNNLRIQAEQEGYGRYRDALSDARYQDEIAYGRYRDEVADARYADELGYSRYRDALSDYRYDDELGYSRWRDSVSDDRYEDELAYQRYRDSVGDSQWEQEFGLKQYNTYNSGSGSSGGSSGGGSRSSGGGGGGDVFIGGPLDGQSAGSGDALTLSEVESTLANAKHSGQVEDLVRSAQADLDAGMANFTQAQLDALLSKYRYDTMARRNVSSYQK